MHEVLGTLLQDASGAGAPSLRVADFLFPSFYRLLISLVRMRCIEASALASAQGAADELAWRLLLNR